jgi:SAM-dependent methyltransferase
MKRCCQCHLSFELSRWNCPSCHHSPKEVDGFLAFSPELSDFNDGFELKLFEQLASLEAKNFWFRSRNQLVFWALKKYFPDAQSFLEVGCGTGYVLSGIETQFPDLKLQGSEIFTRGLNFASERLTNAELFQMDARNIPFDQEFDVIGAFDVIEHIQEDTLVLSELYRATKQGILLTVPQHPWLWSQADDYAHHVRRYRAQELKAKVEAAGFRIIRTTSFVSLLLPLMLASRLKQRKPQQDYDLTAELDLSKGLNSTLEFVMNIERKLIQMGISFPAGGSLLLVAHKP